MESRKRQNYKKRARASRPQRGGKWSTVGREERDGDDNRLCLQTHTNTDTHASKIIVTVSGVKRYVQYLGLNSDNKEHPAVFMNFASPDKTT